jgi:hypothetical protein
LAFKLDWPTFSIIFCVMVSASYVLFVVKLFVVNMFPIQFGPQGTLFSSPAFDLLVVSIHENFGNGMSSKLSGPSILGYSIPRLPLENECHGCSTRDQHAWHQSDDGINDDHRRDFSAVQHIVADGNLARVQDINYSFVKSLIPPHNKNNTRLAGSSSTIG